MIYAMMYRVYCPMCGESRWISEERFIDKKEKCSCQLVPAAWGTAAKSLGAEPVYFGKDSSWLRDH